jgi:RNA polymerase sigma-70 factor (ECF subfamily)
MQQAIYLGMVDSASLTVGVTREPESYLAEISGLAIADLCQKAEANRAGLLKSEFAQSLLDVGARCNYGVAAGQNASRGQIAAFVNGLQLKDLALAQSCALGRDAAWRIFVERYRDPLTQAAIHITGSATLGQELADSIYSEMFGLTVREGQRKSPLALYSGRGSLMGFLRTTLAQRHVDHHRRTNRETPLEGKEFAASAENQPRTDVILKLGEALTLVLRGLGAEERFLLSAWFLDQRTLFEIAQVCRVHESTISRQLKRLTERLQKELLKGLRNLGMSRSAAEEALGTDPRDLNINIRKLLQDSQSSAFLEQRGE